MFNSNLFKSSKMRLKGLFKKSHLNRTSLSKRNKKNLSLILLRSSFKLAVNPKSNNKRARDQSLRCLMKFQMSKKIKSKNQRQMLAINKFT